MKKFLSALFTGFALFFSIPTILILASWNAIPGDTLYSVKSSLEDVALALTANTRIATAFSVNFTDRRFNEAAILLDKKGSTVGYELLVAEAKQSRNMILSKQDKKNGTQLVRKIEEYQADIVTRQAEVQSLVDLSGYNPTPAPYVAPDPTTPPSGESKTVTLITTVEVVIEEEDDEEVVENLEDIFEELEEIKDDIEEELPDMVVEDMNSEEDSSAAEEGPEEDSSAADGETSEETEDSDKKDKDKDKPLKN